MKKWLLYIGLILIGFIAGFEIGVEDTTTRYNKSNQTDELNSSNKENFVGELYRSSDSNFYIKFISQNTIESIWMEHKKPDEFKYTIEENKIRTVSGFGVVRYIDKINENELVFDGVTYYKQ